MSNAFTNYQPVISWRGHDNGTKQSANGAKAAAMAAAKIRLPGSLNGQVLMMDIPPRDCINEDKTLQRDRTDMIKRGGR